jgi:thiol-disulfide isomerase/thioredoxin
MTRSRLLILLGAILAAVLVVLYVIPGAKETAKPPVALAALKPMEKPVMAPNVAFSDAGGRSYALSKYRGRYVLLNLWASWCAPCVRELPSLASLQRAIASKKLAVVAIDVEKGADQIAGKFLIAHQAAELPAFADPDMKVMRATGTFGLPTTILIDPKGREIARATGPAQWDAPEAINYFEALTKGL